MYRTLANCSECLQEVIKMREENPSQLVKKNSILRKKWFLPSMYLACVALVMVGAFWYQGNQDGSKDSKIVKNANEISNHGDQPSVEVNQSFENFALPLTDSENVVIKKQFYDINGSEEQQEAALVQYGDTYQPNTGIDYALKDNASFNVLASMTGTVTRVQTDPLLGNLIEIEHDKGLVTQYSSISDISVKVGDKVEQGSTIAKSARNEINEDANIHLHFEMRKDGVAVNPLNFFKKSLSALKNTSETVQPEKEKGKEKAGQENSETEE